jgi:hypothetical protein
MPAASRRVVGRKLLAAGPQSSSYSPEVSTFGIHCIAVNVESYGKSICGPLVVCRALHRSRRVTDCRLSEHGNGALAIERQGGFEDLRQRPCGRKLGSRVPKRAGDCRSPKTEETQKMPGKAGFLEVRRVSQLGYGDLICEYLENKALRQDTSRKAEHCVRFSQAPLATSACLTRILAGFWDDA